MPHHTNIDDTIAKKLADCTCIGSATYLVANLLPCKPF